MTAFLSIAFSLLLCPLITSDKPPSPFGVSGTVLDTLKEPVPNAEVHLILDSPKGGKLADTVRTNTDGRFSTRGWIVSESDGEGDWRLEVTADGSATSIVDELFAGFGVYDVGPIYLLPPATVTGRVTDTMGRPVAGAEIHAAHGEATWSRFDYEQAGTSAVTADDGTYTLRTLPPGHATVGISARGFTDAVVSKVKLAAHQANSLDFVLERSAPVEGRVVDPDGRPLLSASVEAHSAAFWRTTVAVDVEGNFTVAGLPSDWAGELTARAPKHLAQEGISTDQLEDGPIILQPSGVVLIHVEREGDARPAGLFEVRIRNSKKIKGMACGWADQVNWREIRADSELVKQLGPATWRVSWEAAFHNGDHDCALHSGPPTEVQVTLDDGAFIRSEPSDASWAREIVEVAVRAPRTGQIEGRVLQHDGSPVAGTTVMLNRWSVKRPHLVASTDADGRFDFQGVTPDDLHGLTVDNDQWRGEVMRFDVISGETTRQDVHVAPPPRIYGQITARGESPGEPIVIGLGEFQGKHVVGGGSFGLGISGADGMYTVIPKYSRLFTVVPKRRTGLSEGGYRRFRSEFPETPPESWPWQAQAPRLWKIKLDIDLAE